MNAPQQPNVTLPSFEQAVDSAQLVTILRALAGFGSSGLLAVQGEEDLVSLTFRRGDIVAADAMNRPMEDALCDILAQKGQLAPQDFREILSVPEGAAKLGSELLLESGRLERSVVLAAVREQMFRQSMRLLRWPDGHLQWVADGESPYQEGVVPLTVGELLLRSIDELGPVGPLGAKEPNFDCQYVVAANAEGRFRRRKPGDDSFENEDTGTEDGLHLLSPVDFEVMRKVQAGTATEVLIPDGGRAAWQVRAALHHLWSVGLLERRFRDSGKVKSLSVDLEPRRSKPGTERTSLSSAARREPPSPLTATSEVDEGSEGSRERDNEGDGAIEEGIGEIHRLDLTREPSGPLLSLGDDEEELSRLLEDPPGLAGVDLRGETEAVDVPLDDEPIEEPDPVSSDLLGSLQSRSLDERPALSSGPLLVDEALVREADVIDPSGNELDSHAPWKDEEPRRNPWGFVATLVNVWGVRFLAMILVALVIRLLVGTNQSDEPLRVVTETTDLAVAAERTSWRLLEQKLHRALRIYHLLYGVYPEDLEVLTDLELVSAEDLRGDGDYRLTYQLEDDGFRLNRSSADGAFGPLGEIGGRPDSVDGDFLLNPRYVREVGERDANAEPPVIVLD